MSLLSKIRNDGLMHMMASTLIVVVLSAFIPIWVAVILALLIGTGKEIWDKYHGGCCSWHDILCDAAGVAGGVLISLSYLSLFKY